MTKYDIKLMPRAYRDIDSIYFYIVNKFKAPNTAERIAEKISDAILSLDEFPYRGAIRKVGLYANKGYRQIFVENYTIVYRVDEDAKEVIIVTVSYSPSNF